MLAGGDEGVAREGTGEGEGVALGSEGDGKGSGERDGGRE